MEKAQFWIKKDNKIRCQLCNHYCLISEGKVGICAVRKNIRGELQSLVYGKLIAENDNDPIEKKPLFHFLPGSLTYSIATVGCNLRCMHCQNADISQYSVEEQFKENIVPGHDATPEQVVRRAKDSGCQSIAYTYTEPTIFAEFAIDCMKLAKKAGLKNVWVSNGYTASQAWPKILPYLDAINVDLKFFNNEIYLKVCGCKLQPVLDNLKFLKSAKGGSASGGNNIWLEITTLIIPGFNDSDKELLNIAKFIKNELGDRTPWHVSRFFPQYKLQDTDPTEEERIYTAVQLGKEAGLKYVYGGNVLDESLENTYCPVCGELVIERKGYNIKRFDKDGTCPKCGEKLDLIIK